MHVIEGRENVIRHLQNLLDAVWKKLERRYRRVKPNIMFALIYLLNYKFRPNWENLENVDNPNMINTYQFRVFLRTLDELLIRGWHRIVPLKENEWKRYVEIVLNHFLELGHRREMLVTARDTKMESFTIYDDAPTDTIAYTKGESAFQEWLRDYHSDGEWHKFYYVRSKADTIAIQFRKEIEKQLGIPLEWVVNLNRIMARKIEKSIRLHDEGSNRFFVQWKKDQLLDLLCLHSSERFRIDIEKAKLLLNKLVYAADGEWTRSPFVRLRVYSASDIVYIPIFSALYPHNAFSSAWIDYITRDVSGSKTDGMLGWEWGMCFEEYVRSKIFTHHKHLITEPHSIIVTPSEFPDISDCLGNIKKTKIEIDGLTHSQKKVYVISCKARNRYSAPDMIKNLSTFNFSDFEKKVEQDFKDAGEIESYALCLSQSSDFLDAKGFQGKEIIPILVTSDFRPLSVGSVKEYYSEFPIPDVQIVQAMKLHDYQFK